MPNISQLGNLQPVDTLDVSDTYVAARESTFQLPKKGTYTLEAPVISDASFSATKAGYLSADISPKILGPTNEGFQIRFAKVSAKTFIREGAAVSQLGDYLNACGFRGILNSVQDQADAVEATSGVVYQAQLDWRVYNSKTGFQLEGMEKFPKLPDGSYQSWVEDPTGKDETGAPQRLRANVFIRRFVAAE